MKKQLLAAAMACGVIGMIGTSSAVSAEPSDNAYGYWAGLLCDHDVGGGVTYWESRGYKSRGQCVSAEARSLERGEWDPDDWPI